MSLKNFYIENNTNFKENFVENNHKSTCYQDKDLFWLIVVLTLLNKVSLREKENFLKNLFEHNQLIHFYESIGLNTLENNYPKRCTFNKFFNKKTDIIQKFTNLILLEKKEELNQAFMEYKSHEKNNNLESKTSILDTKYKHYALDGKQILNCAVQTVKKSGSTSQKSICMM